MLTYSSDFPLQPGTTSSSSPLGKRSSPASSQKSPQSRLPDQAHRQTPPPLSLPTHLLKSIFWLSKYYLSPLPAAANLYAPRRYSLPVAPSKTLPHQPTPPKPPPSDFAQNPTSQAQNPHQNTSKLQKSRQIPLSPSQSSPAKCPSGTPGSPGATRLLRGVTGSGKTNIYLKMVRKRPRTAKIHHSPRPRNRPH